MSTPSDTTRTAGSNAIDGVDHLVEGGEVGVVVDPGGRGRFSVVPARARRPLVGVAGEVRVGPVRVAVERDVQHVGAVVEDLLGAVAVVVVDVEDRDAFGAGVPGGLAATMAALLK